MRIRLLYWQQGANVAARMGSLCYTFHKEHCLCLIMRRLVLTVHFAGALLPGTVLEIASAAFDAASPVAPSADALCRRRGSRRFASASSMQRDPGGVQASGYAAREHKQRHGQAPARNRQGVTEGVTAVVQGVLGFDPGADQVGAPDKCF